ncbi:DUF6712 family protein [Arundinibacter roseus]|uniref:Uncharacterized protein n=1 Tax=Arundinibacter roseus TaxID=2070510 RepID=A0A4R4KQB6_9BACT|nr:DUF6712 family protein [Arundinibacter roseus]TDB69112.1 hypothetical protein EZE20_01895 [Arundinibacter roseus]
MILRGVNDIIAYLGRAVMAATSDDFLAPYIQLAQDGELTRALDSAFVSELDTQVEQNNLSPENQALLPYVKKVLAWFAYQHYLPFSIGNDGDNGLQEVGTESTSPVRIGVLDKRIRETERNAVESLEALLQYMESKPVTDYPTYHNSPTGKRTRTLFLSSATTMSEFLPVIERNHRLFINLRPYIVLAEQDYILPRLGQAQFDALKTTLLNGTTSDPQKLLLQKIGRALAHTAYWMALPNLQFVVLPSGNIRVLSDFDGIYNRKNAPSETITYLVEQEKTMSKKHLNALSTFLRKNAEDYPLYAASTAAGQEPTNRLPDNSKYSKVFRMK